MATYVYAYVDIYAGILWRTVVASSFQRNIQWYMSDLKRAFLNEKFASVKSINKYVFFICKWKFLK